MTKFRTSDCATLIRDYLMSRPTSYLSNQADSPEAMARRLHDILHGKTETVSLGVMDKVAMAAGHPEWLWLLEPVS